MKKENELITSEHSALSLEHARLKKTLAEERRQKRALQKKISKLHVYIERNICDPIVLKHLKDIGIIGEELEITVENSTALINSSLASIVENDILTSREIAVLD